MEILDHTDDHQATFMNHIYEALIGKGVVISLSNGQYMGGVLTQYNGYVIKLTASAASITNTYIPVGSIVAVSSND